MSRRVSSVAQRVEAVGPGRPVHVVTSPPKRPDRRSAMEYDRLLHKKLERYRILGAQGEKEQIEVMHAFSIFVEKAQPGAEIRVELAIAGERRAVSMRVDAEGEGVAVLEPRIAAERRFADLDAVKTALAEDFRLTVRDGDRRFSLEELEHVYAAFSLLDPREARSLQGVELTRIAELAPKKDSIEISTDIDRARLSARMFLTDAVLADGKSTTELTLREAAHAIQKLQRFRVGVKAMRLQRALKERWAARDILGSLDEIEEPSLAVQRWRNAARALQIALGHDVSSKRELAEARARITSSSEARRRAFDALEAPEREIVAGAAEKQDAYQADVERYLDTTEAYWRETVVVSEAGRPKLVRSRRLHRFIEFLEREPIVERRSQPKAGRYAELFAETFARFKTDPGKLREESPALYWWFASLQHVE